jgi:hypothetical protein
MTKSTVAPTAIVQPEVRWTIDMMLTTTMTVPSAIQPAPATARPVGFFFFAGSGLRNGKTAPCTSVMDRDARALFLKRMIPDVIRINPRPKEIQLKAMPDDPSYAETA